MNEPINYVNGCFVPASAAALPLNDLGIVRGYGVFDYLRTYDRMPFHLSDHLQRLAGSAAAIGIDLPWTLAELEALVHATHDRNPYDNAGIRIIVTGGPSADLMTPQGRPSLAILVTPLKPLPPASTREGFSATTTVAVRERPTVKSLNYIGAIMAVQAARASGAVEAIYRTTAGFLTEGTRSNLFLFRGDRLITPRDDVLAGITRRVVLDLADDLFEVAEEPVHYDDLPMADEMFLTSTTKEVVPIVAVDEIRIGSGRPGRNTARLVKVFRAYVQELQREWRAASQ